MLSHSSLIHVEKTSNKGYGVFASCFIAERTVIERVPVLVVPTSSMWLPDGDSPFVKYTFAWGKRTVALALGYGSLYNHSYNPNARYDDARGQIKVFTAICDITEGTEITINYNGDPDDPTDVGFAVI
jgi:hypothetical protein